MLVDSLVILGGEHSAPITYTPSSGAPRAINAILDPDDPVEVMEDGQGRLVLCEATLFVHKDANVLGVAAPNRLDKITHEGRIYSVVGFVAHLAMWEMRIRSDDLVDRGPGVYRSKLGS